MAHQIAIAARRLSFTPRRLVLLDPPPPTVGKKPDLQRLPLRLTITGLASTLLAAAAVQGRSDDIDDVQHSVAEELQSCSDTEVATRATQLLVAQSIVEDKVESTARFVRQAQVMNSE